MGSGATAHHVADRPGLRDRVFELPDEIVGRPGHGLNHKATRRAHALVGLDKHTEADRRGDLFRIQQIVGDILADLSRHDGQNAAVGGGQPRLRAHDHKGPAADRPADIELAVPGGQMRPRVIHKAAHVAAGVGINKNSAQRPLADKL